MFTQTIDPIMLNIGPLSIRWYGILYATSILICYYLIEHLFEKRKVMSKILTSEGFFYGVLGIVIGARIGSIISDLPYYLSNPFEIIALWHGGLAFHGGVIGGAIVGYFFCKKNKLNYLEVLGICAFVSLLGLSIGRIGNFINSEFYGTITAWPWGVVFPNVIGARHPVQLYESIAYLVFFVILWGLKDKLSGKKLLSAYFIGYSLIRFPLEYLKDPAQVTHIGILTWGQFFSIPLIAIGIWLWYKK